MSSLRVARDEAPTHIPIDLVVDFDMFAPPGHEDGPQLAWWRVQQSAPPIFWTPRNGGHWVATRAEDIELMQVDHTRFSATRSLIPDIGRPYPVPPLDTDPPEHGPFRLMLSPAFSPKVVAELEGSVRATLIEIIERIRSRGECEFVREVAKVLPVIVFLRMVDIPMDDAQLLIDTTEQIARASDPDVVMGARRFMADYVKTWIERRTDEPGNDLISHIIHYRINGRELTPEQKLGTCSNLLAAGLDTVAAVLSFSAIFLARNPAHRQQLRDRPELIPNAIDELIRRHGVVNTGRLITHDFEYKGVPFRKGELVQLPNSLYGLDPDRVQDPLTVDFTRAAPDHAAFGNGPHRCPGAILARRELKCFLEEWLSRIPDFEIRPGTKPEQSSGIVNGVSRLELVWNPERTLQP